MRYYPQEVRQERAGRSQLRGRSAREQVQEDARLQQGKEGNRVSHLTPEDIPLTNIQ